MATGRIGTTPVLQVRWSKAPSAGTTSLSGLDDNSVSLVYSVGYEAVYRNGVLLSRTNDYTATDGTTITLIDATIAGDIIEVFANQLVPLTDAISKGQFTAKAALLSATAASTPAVLTVGTNNQVLTADSSTSTGLKWATPASGALTKITSASFTTQSSVTIDNIFSSTYKRYMMVLDVLGSTSLQLRMQFRYSSSTEATEYYGSNLEYSRANAASGNGFVNTTYATILNTLEVTPAQLTMYFSGVGNTSERAAFWMNGFNSGDSQSSILGGGRVYVDRTYTGIIFTVDTGTITGTYQVYGLEN